jgi:parvulin-like peptidyl-prolyl isomerase
MGSLGRLRYAQPTVTFVRRSAVLVVALVVVAGVLAGCTGATPYAAIVNGTTISQATLLRELHALGNNAGFVAAYDSNVQQAASQGQTLPSMFGTGTASQTFSQGFTAIVLNTDIQAQLIHDEVVRRTIQPSAAEIAAATAAASAQFPNGADGKSVFTSFDPWFQQEYKVRSAEQAVLATALAPSAKDPAQIKQFYDLNPTNFITNQCVSHILVSSQGEAVAIRARIVAGAAFADQAKKYSTDTGSAAKGGQLGCNGPGQFVADFEQVANTIAVNQLSQPIHTQFGWHLIKVTSRQEQPLDATNTGRIQQYLQQNPVSMFIPPALMQAKVKINPAYGRWDPLQPAVVPPPAPPANSGAPSAVTPTTAPPAVNLSPSSPSSSQAPASGAGAAPTSTP